MAGPLSSGAPLNSVVAYERLSADGHWTMGVEAL